MSPDGIYALRFIILWFVALARQMLSKTLARCGTTGLRYETSLKIALFIHIAYRTLYISLHLRTSPYISVHLRTLSTKHSKRLETNFKACSLTALEALDFWLLQTAVECLSRHRFWDREILKRQWRHPKLSLDIAVPTQLSINCQIIFINLMLFQFLEVITCPFGGEGVTHTSRLPLDCQHGQGQTILQADLEVCSGNHPEMKRSDILMPIGCQVALWSRGPCRSYSQLPRCRLYVAITSGVSKSNFILVQRIASNYLAYWANSGLYSPGTHQISSDWYLRRLKDNIGDKDPEKVRAFVHKARRAEQHCFDVFESCKMLKGLLQSSHGFSWLPVRGETYWDMFTADTAAWCWIMLNHDEPRAGWVMMSHDESCNYFVSVAASSSVCIYALTLFARLELWSGQLRIVRVLAAHAIAMTGVQSRVPEMRCFTRSKCLQSATYCLSFNASPKDLVLLDFLIDLLKVS